MDQEHIGVTILAELDGLTAADGHHIDTSVVRRFEVRQDSIQQPRVLGAGRRRQAEHARLGLGAAGQQNGKHQASEQKSTASG